MYYTLYPGLWLGLQRVIAEGRDAQWVMTVNSIKHPSNHFCGQHFTHNTYTKALACLVPSDRHSNSYTGKPN